MQKKKDLEMRLKERQDEKEKKKAANSPEKKSKKKEFQGETIIDLDGNVIKEPNYAAIRLSKEKQTEVYDKIEELWPSYFATEVGETMSKEEAADLLRQVAE